MFQMPNKLGLSVTLDALNDRNMQ